MAPWAEGEVRLERNVQSTPDGAALLVVHTQATPLGEGVFASRILDGRVTDALPIGAPYPQDSVARRPGGLLPPRALVTDEGYTSILFYGARDADDAAYGALFTRRLGAAHAQEASLRARLAPAPYLPGAGPRWNESPLPTRLDCLDLPVQSVQVLRRWDSTLVLYTQDAHAWALCSSNGVSFLGQSGASTPHLVDNDTSEELAWARLEAAPNLTAFFVLLAKRDGDGDLRLGVRAGSGF